jgi:hypothetical protein
MSQEHTKISIVRLVSGCLRWQHSCVYETIGLAIVDPRDHGWCSEYRWILIPKPGKPGYARRNEWINKKTIGVYMHTEIWIRNNGPISEGLTVDHEDQTTLDNRIQNLRLGSIAQQGFNKKPFVSNRSGYKGVSFQQRTQRYTASIRCSPKRIHLGYFDTAEEAARAYNEAALRLHGEFACLNQIEGNN